MDKQTEIKTLKSLKCDTYFAAFFGEDIDQMCQNISNDFPLELGCNFSKKAEVLEKKLHKEQKAHDQDMLDFVETLLVTEANGGNSLRVAREKIGMDNTIKIKRKNKIVLSEEEIDFWFQNLIKL